MARGGRGSLADQLAELETAAPADYDYDNENDALDAGQRVGGNPRRRHGSASSSADEEEEAEEEARRHARHNVVKGEPSRMRRRANLMEGFDGDGDEASARMTRKYTQGVPTTRRQMLDDIESENDEISLNSQDINDDEDEASEKSDLDSLQQELGGDDASDLDDGEIEGSSGEESEGSSVVTSVHEAFSSDNDDGEDISSSSKPKTNGTTKKVLFARDNADNISSDIDEPVDTLASTSKTAADADAAMINDLRKRSREDAARGRDARRSLDTWGKLLGIRIRGQKVFRNAGRFSTHALQDAIDTFGSEERESLSSTIAALDKLSAHLFTLQRQILETYQKSTEIDGASSSLDYLRVAERPLKRKLDDVEYDTQVATALRLHAEAFAPMWRDVLAKWSWRTSSNSLEDSNKAKNRFDKGNASGLKAMNQSAEEQIKRGLSGEAYERLLKRTRVWRGSEKESRIEGSEEVRHNQELADGDQHQDADVFDDSDFYGALLREFIETRGEAGDAAGSSNGAVASAEWAQAAKRANKKHRAGVDHRASKGRRLRFDVHEKLENFMPPIPRETWSDEQIDRLVRQLRSGSGITFAEAEDGDQGQVKETAASENVSLGGLRLFG